MVSTVYIATNQRKKQYSSTFKNRKQKGWVIFESWATLILYFQHIVPLLVDLRAAKPKEAAAQDNSKIITQSRGLGYTPSPWLARIRFTRISLKYGSQEKISLCCRCSSFLSPTFVEIKNSFTRTLLTFNSKNFGIICYRKNTDENEPI